MLEVTLYIKSLESWAIDISKKLGTSIRIMESAMGESGEISSLVEFRLEGTSKEAIMEELNRHPDTADFQVSEEREDILLGNLTMNRWMVGKALQRQNCYILGAKTLKEGTVEWRLLLTEEAVLKELISDLMEAGSEVVLKKKRRRNDIRLLSHRQEQIMEKALEMGYFDYPRGISGRELARGLNISQSTLYETLQNGERKLVESYFLRRRTR